MAMVAIFSDPFLSSQVAMRGGTALHKIHLGPATRYSEDIDLVLIGDRPIGDIERGLNRVLASLLGKPAERLMTTVQLAVRNWFKPSNIIRLVYVYKPTVTPPSTMRVKIEVNYSETKPCYPVAGMPYHPPINGLSGPVTIRSFVLNEMLGTKMRALLQRTQGRDLYDLDRACALLESALKSGGALPFDPDMVVTVFGIYMEKEGSSVTRTQYSASLRAKCADPSFRRDMGKVLPRGVHFNVDEAARRVTEVLISRLSEE
jgi:hypothetical protein